MCNQHDDKRCEHESATSDAEPHLRSSTSYGRDCEGPQTLYAPLDHLRISGRFGVFPYSSSPTRKIRAASRSMKSALASSSAMDSASCHAGTSPEGSRIIMAT